MNRNRWWALAALWFAGVGLFWSAYLSERAEADRQARRVAAWQATIERVQAVAPAEAHAAAPPTREAPAGERSGETMPAPLTRSRVAPAGLMGHVRSLAFERHTLDQRKRARALIGHALTEMGYRPDLHGYATGVNIIAERPGTDPRAKAVLVGAHFDSVKGTPGADDNASGVAVALEVARQLKDVSTLRPLRVVFFDEEERGLIGSGRYAASPFRIEALAAVIVLEMVGFTCHTPGCQRFPPGLPPGLAPDTGHFVAVVGDLENLWMLEAFRRASGPAGPVRPPAGSTVAVRPPVFALPVPDKGDRLPDTRRSDHAPFWDAGVPAVMVTDTAELRSPHYHRASDTPETLDAAFMAGVAEVTIDATRALLDAPLRPEELAKPRTADDQVRGER